MTYDLETDLLEIKTMSLKLKTLRCTEELVEL